MTSFPAGVNAWSPQATDTPREGQSVMRDLAQLRSSSEGILSPEWLTCARRDPPIYIGN